MKKRCKICDGKGYSTRLWGGGVCYDDSSDFKTTYYRIPLQLEIRPCKCKKMTKYGIIKIAKAEHKKLGIEYRPI